MKLKLKNLICLIKNLSQALRKSKNKSFDMSLKLMQCSLRLIGGDKKVSSATLNLSLSDRSLIVTITTVKCFPIPSSFCIKILI